ncbi:MAG: acetyl-CoA carboxylase biotin carboxyl carrier protein [Pseudomonadota bacterium]
MVEHKDDWQQLKKRISELSDLLNKKDLSEIDLQCEMMNVVLRRERMGSTGASNSQVSGDLLKQALQQQIQTASIQKAEGEALKSGDQHSSDTLRSPMVGTIYLSPSPDKDAYVSVGEAVKKGDVVMIIEAMKVMNQIVAHQSGVVDQILVSNEQAVEFDQPLITIKP